MKSDARIRYTKMVIKDSFIQLLKSQPINKITVKDVCELAEINRATFYKHYTDCFNLLSQIEEEAISELQEIIHSTQHTNMADVFGKMLTKMKEKGSLYFTLFSDNGDSKFPARIFNLCYEQMNLPIENQFPEISKTEREWLYYFTAHGCSGIMNHWINSGMNEDISEISKFVGKLSINILN